MNYRKLGRTNLKVSVIGLGGGALNPNKDPSLTLDEAKEVISYAVKNGVNFIDTGKEYDEEFISKAIGKEKLHIATKSEAKTKKEMDEDIKDSLEKFGVESIDIYQMHMVESIKDLDKRIKNGVLDSLKEAKSKGLIKYIGIFSHKIEVLIKAVKTGYFDVVLVLYNVGHRKAEELFDYTKKYDVGVIVAAPFGGGILVDQRIEEISNPKAKDMVAENALSFILFNENISTTIPGSRTLKEVKENIDVGNKNLNLSTRGVYEKVKNFLGEDFCRGCRYCEPCDVCKSLPISEILKLKILYEKYDYRIRPKIEYLELKVKGDVCTQCGKCLSRCPYNIPISKLLLEAHKTLTITDSDLKEWALGEIICYNMNELKQKFVENYNLLFKNKVKIEKISDEILQIKKELVEKNNEIKDKDKMIKDRNDGLKDRDDRLRKLEMDLKVRENELRDLDEKFLSKETELNRIYNSRMYKYFISHVWNVHRKAKKILSKD